MQRYVYVAAAFIAAATTTVGCNDGGSAETAGGSQGTTVSKSKDDEIRKGMKSYPKSIDEVPPQYRHMIIDGKSGKAPDASQVKPVAPK